jgi:hypothetical protein
MPAAEQSAQQDSQRSALEPEVDPEQRYCYCLKLSTSTNSTIPAGVRHMRSQRLRSQRACSECIGHSTAQHSIEDRIPSSAPAHWSQPQLVCCHSCTPAPLHLSQAALPMLASLSITDTLLAACNSPPSVRHKDCLPRPLYDVNGLGCWPVRLLCARVHMAEPGHCLTLNLGLPRQQQLREGNMGAVKWLAAVAGAAALDWHGERQASTMPAWAGVSK